MGVSEEHGTTGISNKGKVLAPDHQPDPDVRTSKSGCSPIDSWRIGGGGPRTILLFFSQVVNYVRPATGCLTCRNLRRAYSKPSSMSGTVKKKAMKTLQSIGLVWLVWQD